MFQQPWTDYPAFGSCPPHGQADLPDLLQRTVCIPYHPTLPFRDAQHVAEHITDALSTSEGSR